MGAAGSKARCSLLPWNELSLGNRDRMHWFGWRDSGGLHDENESLVS